MDGWIGKEVIMLVFLARGSFIVMYMQKNICIYMHLYLSPSLPCGLFKSHPHRPTVTCTVLACVDAVACGFFQ